MFSDDCIIAVIAKGFIGECFRSKKDTICIKHRAAERLATRTASNTLRCNHTFLIEISDSLTN